jgi:hypothetical protein
MNDDSNSAALQDYLERWGMLFELLGGARMMGKILGWLLVCDPPEQTAAEIAKAVGASAGSVSTTTRMLVQASMIERVGIRGERSARFRVRTGMWAQLLKRRMEHLMSMKGLADLGLKLAPKLDDDGRLRLKELARYCTFIENEVPGFIARWEKVWEEEKHS